MSESFVPLAWMATGVSFLEVGDRQSNVVLKRIEVLVSEKFFDVPEICATADEFRRAGAPKRVGRNREWQVQRGRIGRDAATNRSVG